MARALTSGMQAAVVASEIKPFLLMQAQFDSGQLNLWTGFGRLTIGETTYTGAGDLITMSAIKETTELEAMGISITLQGQSPELLAIAHNEPYQNRPLNVYLGLFNNSWQIISDPYMLYEGRMDVMILGDDADGCTIEMQVENVLIDLLRPTILNYTPEDQALFFAGDSGFNFVASLQEKELLLAG